MRRDARRSIEKRQASVLPELWVKVRKTGARLNDLALGLLVWRQKKPGGPKKEEVTLA